MSRFAIDPKWLIYLPPTMSPCETSKEPSLLEHPQEAFSYYRHEGVPHVICEQKHMGSRAVVVLCREETVSQRRFGVVAATSWGGLHSHRQTIFQRRRDRKRISAAAARCGGNLWSVVRAGDRLDVPRLRADALVIQGAGVVAPAICSGRQLRRSGSSSRRVAVGEGNRAHSGARFAEGENRSTFGLLWSAMFANTASTVGQ